MTTEDRSDSVLTGDDVGGSRTDSPKDSTSATTTLERPPDKRWETRRRLERERKRRIRERLEERRRKENAVLAVAASGASLTEIAREVGLSVSYVHELYHSAMKRVQGEGVAEFREAMQHRLGVLLRSAWSEALAPPEDEKVPAAVRSAARRDVLAICAEMSRLEGAYPPAQVDVVGEMTVRRELSLEEALEAAREIHAARLARGEAELPPGMIDATARELEPSANGSEPEPDSEEGEAA